MKILLIHGLARTSLSLKALEWRLQQAGYSTEQLGYFAFAESFDSIASRLWLKLQALSQEPYALVAHSLGGLLVRSALGKGPLSRLPEHIVMLGTPNHPPRLALHAWRVLPFQWFTGQCGLNLTDPTFFAQLPTLPSPYTLIVGTAGPRGRWSPFGEEVNDGIVALSEARLGERDRILSFPVWHTFMMNDAAVQQAVITALQPPAVDPLRAVEGDSQKPRSQYVG